MNKFKKCSLDELKEVWEGFGWVVFNKFEDYVIEVRRIESDLQKGKISLKGLKDENNKKIRQVQSRFEADSDNAFL